MPPGTVVGQRHRRSGRLCVTASPKLSPARKQGDFDNGCASATRRKVMEFRPAVHPAPGGWLCGRKARLRWHRLSSLCQVPPAFGPVLPVKHPPGLIRKPASSERCPPGWKRKWLQGPPPWQGDLNRLQVHLGARHPKPRPGCHCVRSWLSSSDNSDSMLPSVTTTSTPRLACETSGATAWDASKPLTLTSYDEMPWEIR